MKPPAVPPPIWVQVVTRAARRCECIGQCGRDHLALEAPPSADPPTADESRCVEGPGRPVVGLLVAPRSVAIAASESWRLPVEQLATWCAECFTGAFATARPERAECRMVDPGIAR